MKRRRVDLNQKYSSKADEILKKTGIKNCSQLLSFFLIYFGDELIQRLEGQKELNNE